MCDTDRVVLMAFEQEMQQISAILLILLIHYEFGRVCLYLYKHLHLCIHVAQLCEHLHSFVLECVCLLVCA